jgi:phosphatidate cytidylyltransferase
MGPGFVLSANRLFPSGLRDSNSLDAAVSLLGFFYIGMGLFSVWFLHSFGGKSRLLVFCLLVIVWSGDISAYLVGTYLGRRKLAPRISPNKTWEGTIASLVTGTALGSVVLLNANSIFAWLVSHHLIYSWQQWMVGTYASLVCPTWFAVTASALINVAAQLGDLAESAMKRGASLKDSGAILPGHGGMLDRVDALLFAAPVAMLLFALGPTTAIYYNFP